MGLRAVLESQDSWGGIRLILLLHVLIAQLDLDRCDLQGGILARISLVWSIEFLDAAEHDILVVKACRTPERRNLLLPLIQRRD